VARSKGGRKIEAIASRKHAPDSATKGVKRWPHAAVADVLEAVAPRRVVTVVCGQTLADQNVER
jgi:hypothetical protein